MQSETDLSQAERHKQKGHWANFFNETHDAPDNIGIRVKNTLLLHVACPIIIKSFIPPKQCLQFHFTVRRRGKNLFWPRRSIWAMCRALLEICVRRIFYNITSWLCRYSKQSVFGLSLAELLPLLGNCSMKCPTQRRWDFFHPHASNDNMYYVCCVRAASWDSICMYMLAFKFSRGDPSGCVR